MNNNIYIDLNRFENTIELFKSIKEKINTIKESQITSTKNITENWGGKVGEDISKELNDHIKLYESYISNIDQKIAFLEKVKASYKSTDENLDKKIDNNLNYNK